MSTSRGEVDYMTKKQLAIYAAVFFAGVIVAPGTETVEKTVTVPDTHTKAQMVQLRDIDNQGFGYAADSMGACGAMLTAATNLDAAAITHQATVLDDITEDFTQLTVKRNRLLEEAGIPNEQ
jgi:hypothetical protein